MMRLVRLICGFAAALLLVSVSGCLPSERSEAEEAREPHFVDGKAHVNSMDYEGAIEEFKKALKVNPESALAHYELGWLYEQKVLDPAAAIYHYQSYLQLRPGADNAELIRQRITSCKQDLAKTVLPLPITPNVQRQLEPLIDEVKRLREENENWKAYFARVSPGMSNPPAPAAAQVRAAVGSNVAQSLSPARATPPTATRPALSFRMHTIQQGESPYSIAKKYGVKLDALTAANPGLDPRRLKVGQTLKIPSP